MTHTMHIKLEKKIESKELLYRHFCTAKWFWCWTFSAYFIGHFFFVIHRVHFFAVVVSRTNPSDCLLFHRVVEWAPCYCTSLLHVKNTQLLNISMSFALFPSFYTSFFLIWSYASFSRNTLISAHCHTLFEALNWACVIALHIKILSQFEFQ